MVKNRYMDIFIECASRIGAQRHLVAIRDGFITIMPLIIVGSLAILINNFPPLGSFHLVDILNNTFGEGNWQFVGSSIWMGTFAIIGILVAFSISYHLAKSYHMNGLSAGLLTIAVYLILVPLTPDGGLNVDWLGAQGLFVAIILAVLVTEFTRLFITLGITIKMPQGVPEGVANSFKALIPAIIILVSVGLFQSLLSIFIEKSIFEVIFTLIQRPLQGLGNTLAAALIVSFSTHILWFFGLHGTNILGAVIEPLYLPLIQENIELWNNGVSAFDVPNIITKPFLDTYVFMGGAGTTVSLIIAIFIAVREEKKHPYREVAKFSSPAGLFNINEPIIFGLPIVLNPIMLIPFVFVPVLLTIISYSALAINFVPKTVAMLPWATPPIISGYLVSGGSWRGVLLQIVNLTVSVFVYLPFVVMGIRTMKKEKDYKS